MPGGRAPVVRHGGRHTLIDRRLFLPGAWAADEERRQLAGVPEQVMFASKPQLAVEMLARRYAGGVTDAWLAADEVYGGREPAPRSAPWPTACDRREDRPPGEHPGRHLHRYRPGQTHARPVLAATADRQRHQRRDVP
ncbi:transposase [Herbidospora mongoliensis]|uniref:transposase n=1 Tax=Herbidospora mongoliensis TaxID=688067 RepID=UPI000A07639A